MAVYIHCSSNNRAETVGNLFCLAVDEYCWPSRVRADKGVENGEVARLMLSKHGAGRGSIILGSSVHNQRIERLWRDVRKMVVEYYRKLFYFMEEQNLLDPTDEVDLFCLHYVYHQKINLALSKFKEAWNNHKLSTEVGKSPNQLYILGMLQNFGSNYRSVKEFRERGEIDDVDNYGVDIPSAEDYSDESRDDTDNNVTVPIISVNIPDACCEELREEISSAMYHNSNHYIITYMQCKQIISRYISTRNISQ